MAIFFVAGRCCRDAMHGVSTAENPCLHHKNVYVRVGGDLPIHDHYGFHHYAMWGGTSPEYGDLPDSWDTYKKIFLARKREKENAPIQGWSIDGEIGGGEQGLDVGIVFVWASLSPLFVIVLLCHFHVTFPCFLTQNGKFTVHLKQLNGFSFEIFPDKGF